MPSLLDPLFILANALFGSRTLPTTPTTTVSYSTAIDPFGFGKDEIGFLSSQPYQDLLAQVNTVAGGVPLSEFAKTNTDLNTMLTLNSLYDEIVNQYNKYSAQSVIPGEGGISPFLRSIYDDLNLATSPLTVKDVIVGYYNGIPVTTNQVIGNLQNSYYIGTDNKLHFIPYEEDDSGFFSQLASIATGGLSDVISGNAPGASLGSVGTLAGAVFNPALASGQNILEGIQNEDYGKIINNLVDPITEPGIDTASRLIGSATESIIPGFQSTVNTINPYVAGIMSAAGAPPWMTLAAYEAANKVAGGSAEQGLVGGASIGASALVPNVYDYVSSGLSPYIGEGASSVAAGAASGAAKSGASAIANAIQTGDWSKVPLQTLLGGAVGGVKSGVSELWDYFSTPSELERTSQSLAAALGGVLTGEQPSEMDRLINAYLSSGSRIPGYSNFLLDPTLFNTLPSNLDNYTVGSYTFPNQEPWNNLSIVGKAPSYEETISGLFYQPGTNSIGSLGLAYQPLSTAYERLYGLQSGSTSGSSGILDTLNTYASKIGDFMSTYSEPIAKLAGALTTLQPTNPIFQEPEVIRPGRAFDLLDVLANPPWVGKSSKKGLEASLARVSRYKPFIPYLSEIEGFNNQDTYYT